MHFVFLFAADSALFAGAFCLRALCLNKRLARPGTYLGLPHEGAFPAALYLLFAALDLLFSLVAFSLGIMEGNPFMAWLLQHGLFVSGKIALSLAMAVLMLVIHAQSRRWRWVVWGGVGMMGSVVAFHLWALPLILPVRLFVQAP